MVWPVPCTDLTTYQLVTDRNSDFDWGKLTLGPWKKVGLVTCQWYCHFCSWLACTWLTCRMDRQLLRCASNKTRKKLPRGTRLLKGGVSHVPFRLGNRLVTGGSYKPLNLIAISDLKCRSKSNLLKLIPFVGIISVSLHTDKICFSFKIVNHCPWFCSAYGYELIYLQKELDPFHLQSIFCSTKFNSFSFCPCRRLVEVILSTHTLLVAKLVSGYAQLYLMWYFFLNIFSWLIHRNEGVKWSLVCRIVQWRAACLLCVGRAARGCQSPSEAGPDRSPRR